MILDLPNRKEPNDILYPFLQTLQNIQTVSNYDAVVLKSDNDEWVVFKNETTYKKTAPEKYEFDGETYTTMLHKDTKRHEMVADQFTDGNSFGMPSDAYVFCSDEMQEELWEEAV